MRWGNGGSLVKTHFGSGTEPISERFGKELH